MKKLLIRCPHDELRKVIEIDESGGYFDQSRILWDDSKDGPIPSDMIDPVPSPNVKELRAAEYAKLDGIKNEAIVELLIENRPEKMEEYKRLRNAIKLKFPKKGQ